MPGAKAPILTKAEAGRIGARRRWGPQRVVRLDEVPAPVAAAIRALIAADEAARKEKAVDGNPITSTAPATTEGRSSASSSD